MVKSKQSIIESIIYLQSKRSISEKIMYAQTTESKGLFWSLKLYVYFILISKIKKLII